MPHRQCVQQTALCFSSVSNRLPEEYRETCSISLWFQPVCYHCCLSSCVCYTGPYETLKQCPKCNTDRYKANGTTPQAIFQYLPIIPCLHTMLASSSYAMKMQYRSKHEEDPTKITDIFDGTHYHSLRETFIMIGDE